MDPGSHPTLLDIGCSGGEAIQLLEDNGYERVKGIDASGTAIARGRRRGLDVDVMNATGTLFADESFDALIASDVLEHIEDENQALVEWLRLLRGGGWLVVYVPAFMALWSEHDVVNDHFRRYRVKPLHDALVAVGFEVEHASYWNTGLFPVIWAIRRLFRSKAARGSGEGDLKPTAEPLNGILLQWLRIENTLIARGIRMPVGVSAFAIARKPNRGTF